MKTNLVNQLTLLSACIMLAAGIICELFLSIHRPLAFSAILLTALTALTWFDLRYMILPNLITFPLIVMGLVWTWWSDGSWVNSLAGLAIGYLGVRALNLVWQVRRGLDGIGQGDAKLLAAAGAWLGGFALAPVILISSSSTIATLLISGRGSLPNYNTRIPFGPFLAFGFWVTWALRLGPLV